MLIHVTPEDWRVGCLRWCAGERPCDCCAVAVAVERATGCECSVSRAAITVRTPDGRSRLFKMPRVAGDIVRAFDAETCAVEARVRDDRPAYRAETPLPPRVYGAFYLPI